MASRQCAIGDLIGQQLQSCEHKNCPCTILSFMISLNKPLVENKTRGKRRKRSNTKKQERPSAPLCGLPITDLNLPPLESGPVAFSPVPEFGPLQHTFDSPYQTL